jgi:uncharacterized protein YjbJ (UPF0337 family)
MTIALPTHFADAMSSAASTGMEAAGSLLHDVSHAAESAAGATSGKAKRLLRASRRCMSSRSSAHNVRRGLWLWLVVAGAAVLAGLAIRRRKFDRTDARVATEPDGDSPMPFTNERNATMTSVQTDDIKGRFKEAAGALTDNDDLKKEGKRDQAASTVQDAVDSARDKIEDGIDAVKDKLDRK